MKKNILTIAFVLVSCLLFGQKDLKNEINDHVNRQAKASQYEYNLYESLFSYQTLIESIKSKASDANPEESRKLNGLSSTSSNALADYKKTYESLDLSTKAVRKKHFDVFVVDAQKFLDELDAQAASFKNEGSEDFAKKTSAFIHQYADILDFKPGSRLSLSKIEALSGFKANSAALQQEYAAKKGSLKDEFKVAHESTGIIDAYSKKRLYSEFFSGLENISSNSALQSDLERMILFYKDSFNSSYAAYHQQFPSYFIDLSHRMTTVLDFYTSLGFALASNAQAEANGVQTQSRTLEAYQVSPEFDAYSIDKNSDLLRYTHLNPNDYKTPFKEYTHEETTVHPTLESWLRKDGSIFADDPTNYPIMDVIPVSEPFGRYRWGVWKSDDGAEIQNAYAMKQKFIVTYQDLSSNKCYAANITASFLETNHVFVSKDDVQRTHTRLIGCR